MFPSAQERICDKTAFRNRVTKPALKRVGLSQRIRSHDLRHKAVTLAIEAGWHPRKIQEMLGHSSIKVTLGTYGHLFDSLHGEGADRLDQIFRASVSGTSAEVFPSSAHRLPRSPFLSKRARSF